MVEKVVYQGSSTTPLHYSDATIKTHLNDHWCIQPGSHAEVIRKGNNPITARQVYRDPKFFSQKNGREFFKAGFLWNDASQEEQSDPNFRLGYCQALRINLESYYIGFKAYVDNKSKADLSQVYRNNVSFNQGYDDANRLCSRYGISFLDDVCMKMYVFGMKFADIGESFDFIPSECIENDNVNNDFLEGYNNYLNIDSIRRCRR